MNKLNRMFFRSTWAKVLLLFLFQFASISAEATVSVVPSRDSQGAANTAAAAPAQATEGEVVDELIQAQERQKREYEALNQLNPMAAGATSGAGQGEDPAGQAMINQSVAFAKLESLFGKRFVEGLIKLKGSPTFLKNIMTIQAHPDRTRLMYIELGTLVFFLLYRSWRTWKLQSSGDVGWFRIFFFRMVILILFLLVSSVLIPSLILGQPYNDVMLEIAQAFFPGFKI